MQKLSAEDTGFASRWGGFYCVTCGCTILFDICCCLGCQSASIIFMGGPRYSCKSPIPPLVFQTDYGVFFGNWSYFLRCKYLALSVVVISWLNNMLSMWKPIVGQERGFYKLATNWRYCRETSRILRLNVG